MIAKVVPFATIGACLIIVGLIAFAEIRFLRVQHDRDSERIESLERENGLLIKTLENANMALERSRVAIERAIGENNERLAKIDDANDDWLQCPLPDSVREAFTRTCHTDATGSAADSMQLPR